MRLISLALKGINVKDMTFVVGKKIGMNRKYNKEGVITPVTLISVEDCYISQLKDEKKDKYQAVQIAFNEVRKKDGRKVGHLKKAEIKANLNNFVEFRVNDLTKYKLGDKINISGFKIGEKVDVIGVSKGKGFTGVMKRHGFHGANSSHGHKHDLRSGGSIGAAYPQHVFKGQKMPGRAGGEQVTSKNLEIVDINEDDGVFAVKGSISGPNGAYLEVRSLVVK